MALTLSIATSVGTMSVAGNYTPVTVSVVISWNGGSYDHNGYSKYVTIDGSTYSFNSVKVNPNRTTTGSQTLYSVTPNIAHNSNGEKTLSVYASVKTATSSGTVTKAHSQVLPTIPRATAPNLSASSVPLGSAVTISTPRASSAFTHTLTYSFAGASGTIATGVGTSYAWTVPLSLANQIPRASSGTVTITCYTYSGSTHIGTASVNLTVTVPTTVLPSIVSITAVDTVKLGDLTLDDKYGAFVNTKSIPRVTVNAAATYSVITSYKAEFQGVATTATTKDFILAVLNRTGDVPIKITVTDGRGRTATSTLNISVLPYFPPKGSLSASRLLATESTIVSEAKAEVAALNESHSITLEYKKKSQEVYTRVKAWNDYTVDEILPLTETDITVSYDLQLTITDDFTTVVIMATAPTAEAILNFRANGKGFAVGKVSESDGFEVDWDAKFNKSLSIQGVDMTITEAEYDELMALLGE